ncbi:uncharacterized protein [Bombus fervidus]|uniref:uncharacterized protein n=1 Tax=Bombus fervidus TaxID=203811 RepID=UPI003D1894DE
MFFSDRSQMDVFYRQYNTYRILLSIVGLWPYHKSIYSTIHRISISVIMLAYIVFEVLLLLKSDITFRGCIVTLSTTCPVMVIFLRYVTSVAVSPVTKYVFHYLRTTHTMLKDQLEVQILMKHVDHSAHVFSIFLCKKTFSMFIEFVPVAAITFCVVGFIRENDEYRTPCTKITLVTAGTRLTAFASTKAFGCKDIMLSLNHSLPILGLCCSWTLFGGFYVFTPITLDLLMPLNQSRRRYFSYLSMFSHDRIEYVDMVYMNILVVYTIGLLCGAGTELTLAVFAHWMCGMFEITRYECYRLRKTIACLSSSKQIALNFRDFRYVVDNHRNTLQLCILSDTTIRRYNSTWYCMPVKAQKLLLFIMLRSSTESVINLFGFFVASHVGFTTLLSTSFSYFTVIYSNQ